MNNKKLIQIVIILVVGFWIATIGTVTVLKVFNAESTTASSESHTTAEVGESSTKVSEEKISIGGNNVITTVQGETPQWKLDEIASIEASKQAAKTTTKKSSSKVTTTKKSAIVPTGKAEIISAYVKGINNLKKTKKFNLIKETSLEIYVDEITGGSIVKSATEAFLEEKRNQEPEAYYFTEGVDSSTGTRPTEVIPPFDSEAVLNKSIVTSAAAKELTGGGYKLTLKIADETATYDSPDLKLSGVLPVLDINSFMVSGATLEDYEINYSNSQIEATFDKNNRIIRLQLYMGVSQATGNGKFTLIPVTMSMHGDYNGSFTVTY